MRSPETNPQNYTSNQAKWDTHLRDVAESTRPARSNPPLPRRSGWSAKARRSRKARSRRSPTAQPRENRKKPRLVGFTNVFSQQSEPHMGQKLICCGQKAEILNQDIGRSICCGPSLFQRGNNNQKWGPLKEPENLQTRKPRQPPIVLRE